MKLFTSLTAATLLTVTATSASADFTSFVIRHGASGAPGIQANNTYVPGATEFIINETGMKAGWGSNDINGTAVGDITSLSITRHDDTTRFAAGSGPATAPYFNIWVTDGAGQFAVLANEPTNPAFQSLFTTNGDGSKTYDLSFTDLADKVVQVYETPNGGYGATNTWVHNAVGINGPLTFGDLAGLTILAPDASYLANGVNAVGTGAPDELTTYSAYGFNWIFGDTQANYVSGVSEGYIVSSPSAVPEPGSLALLGLGGLALLRRRR